MNGRRFSLIEMLSGAAMMALAIAPKAAAVASFDCAKATLAYDKFICATPPLSAADERVIATYEEARSQLSEEGKRLLLEGQRSWLKYVRGFCPLKRACLESAYYDRSKTLQGVYSVVPFRFQSVDSYEVE